MILWNGSIKLVTPSKKDPRIKRENVQTANNKNARGNITKNLTNIKRIKNYYEQLHANKFDKLHEMDKFLEKFNTQIQNETETSIALYLLKKHNFLKKNVPRIKYLKKKIILLLQKLFHKHRLNRDYLTIYFVRLEQPWYKSMSKTLEAKKIRPVFLMSIYKNSSQNISKHIKSLIIRGFYTRNVNFNIWNKFTILTKNKNISTDKKMHLTKFKIQLFNH